MGRIFQRFPLIWVVAMFAILIAAWTVFITLAVKNAPEQIIVEKPSRTSR